MRLLCIGILAGILTAADVAQIRANMEKVMGPLPVKSTAPVAVELLEEETTPTFTRRKITYLSEGADRVPAYVLIPKGKAGKFPAMVCLHQTTKLGKAEPAGTGPKVNLHYGKELAERGYVVIAPDYPGFGDYVLDAYAMGYASATMKGIVNHRRAIDVLRSMPEVDANRIGVIGHSLGGHNSLFLAAFDERIKAVVTSCGFTSFAKYYGGNLTGWSHKGYMPRIADVFEKSPARMPFDFSDVLTAIAPRPVFINAPLHDANFEVTGVQDCVRIALPAYGSRQGNLVAEYPNAAHDFPPEVRHRAYAFLDSHLH
ncbi:MAG: alpha/beta fold hydrolase [Acidobacteriia bacterium]|nr:alpha/beta fold hydrolase [Terriglobia bacterium]